MNLSIPISREHGSGARETGARRAGISHPIASLLRQHLFPEQFDKPFQQWLPF